MNSPRIETIIASLNQRQDDLTVIMENVTKVHNLAAVARTSDAIGLLDIHAITDRKSIKLTSMSASGVKKWITVHTHKNAETGIQHLKQQGMQIITTCLDETAIDYREPDYTKPTAIVMGTELEGTSQTAIDMSDIHVMIPMAGLVQSLNVSVATALILYEAYRQRMAAGMYDKRRLNDERYYKLLFEWCHPKVARYCKQKNLPYPKINEQAEILEPVADSTTHSSETYSEWLKRKKL